MTSKKNVAQTDTKTVFKIKDVDTKSTFPIVGIGASAGGLEAFEKFFSHLSKMGMAYVLITHLDRNHASNLPELIRNYTSLPVVLIKNNTLIKPDTIYVIPIKKNICIKKNKLNLIEQNVSHYKNHPINLFFESLAKDRKENAIAIILSGSGADGSLSLRKIKDYGGLTIAQDPETAGYESMPRSAINTGLIDYVLPAEEIPELLMKHINYGKVNPGKISPELQQIFLLLRMRTEHDFSQYKLNTVMRRIEKMMFSHHIKTLADYVHFLRLNLHEVDNLFKVLLIGVTRFFRDPGAFQTLQKKILPSFLKNKPAGYGIRVWVSACSTGEEAYSMAIILHECILELKKDIHVQIFATDIDLNALKIARNAVYPLSISEDVGTERLKRFFIKEKNQYKVNKEIRSMVIFGEQNVIKDPPFTKLDIISCRNLLIYLNIPLQKKLLPIFHYSLKPKGIIVLGTSEVTSGFNDLFQLIAKKWKIFERKDVSTGPKALLEFAALSAAHHIENTACDREEIIMNRNLRFIQMIQAFLLNEYISPCLVISKNGNILYRHNNVEKYLMNIKGKKNLTLTEHVPADIKKIITPAIQRVESQQTEATYKNIAIKFQHKRTMINLRVIPIPTTYLLSNENLFLIIFEESINATFTELNALTVHSNNLKLEEVVNELYYTKESLQVTVEQLEAGNEELQSANEELQSTNEEIETSREELQSLNEELIIVNTELQNMIDQLANINDDMTNLFNSTEIIALFLDGNLNIKRFTPKTQKFIHLIEKDIGRSISHFSTTIKYHNLIADVKEVLKTLVQKSVEVMTDDLKWFNIRILPYRTLTNVIDGVVIILTDITRFKEYEDKLRSLNDELKTSLIYTENIVNTIKQPLLVLGTDLKVVSVNKAFYKTFKLTEPAVLGRAIFTIKKEWNNKKFIKLLENVVHKNEILEDYEFIHKSRKSNQKFLVNARKICNQQAVATHMILLVMESVYEKETVNGFATESKKNI